MLNAARNGLFIGLVIFIGSLAATAAHSRDLATYSKDIKPVFQSKCAGCHGEKAPEYKEFKKDKEKYKTLLKGPRMDTYPHLIYFVGWPDTGALMRRLDDGKNTEDGKPGNMYQYLGDSDGERRENLLLFREWVGHWTLKRWKDITKEELNEITIPY